MTPREDEFDLPQPLREALRDLHGIPPHVPARMDDRILRSAREGVANRVRARRVLRWCTAGAAVAASVAIFIAVQTNRPAAPTPMVATAPPADHLTPDGDVDDNGRVDILDALVLARKVDSGETTWRRWEDVDRDGKVTRADVEQIAQAAVKLPERAAGGALQ